MAETQKLANLAEVHLAKGEPGKAAALLEELIKRQPENQQAKLQLAQSRLRLGEIEGCQGLVDEVFKGESQSPWALHAYGLIEFARHNWAQALEHFRQAAAAAPALPQIQRQIGTTCLRLGKLSQAEASLRKSLALEGDNPVTYDGLGMALYRQKKYAPAEECFLRSLGCLYHQPLVHFHLGIALAAEGKLTPAIQSLQRALEFNPNLKEAHQVLIKVYRARGNEALAHYHKTKAQELPEPEAAAQELPSVP
jgi:Flp pilus assembly protein TadD